MDVETAKELTERLSTQSSTEATKALTRYYAQARFKIKGDFVNQYCDGTNDGGIDFYHREDGTLFIFQTKYTANPHAQSRVEIAHELQKIKNTLTGENPNKSAQSFVNQVQASIADNSCMLEVVWLTTNFVSESLRDQMQDDLQKWRKGKGWSMAVDFIVVDQSALDSVIYDVNHGYTPSTGKHSLDVEPGQSMVTNWEQTGVYSITFTANVNGILKWFKSSDDVDLFLQKNVRGFEGDTKINNGVKASYLNDPQWFWYKHNGIIMFVDNLQFDQLNCKLHLRNPQIVNGGQTLRTLFAAYDKNKRAPNSAQVVLRVYRLPYEHTETYKRSIEIISALNSQNKILASDLRSTDPRQVRLEHRLEEVGAGFHYFRKRSKEIKASRLSITMRNLALRYYVCKKEAPNEGVSSSGERIFEEPARYDVVFPETAIYKQLNDHHVVVNYLTCWIIDQILQKEAKPALAKTYREYFQYTRWFVLADAYRKVTNWKTAKYQYDWRKWVGFLRSPHFQETLLKYSLPVFKIGNIIVPSDDEARSFFRSSEANGIYLAKAWSHKLNLAPAFSDYMASID